MQQTNHLKAIEALEAILDNDILEGDIPLQMGVQDIIADYRGIPSVGEFMDEKPLKSYFEGFILGDQS